MCFELTESLSVYTFYGLQTDSDEHHKDIIPIIQKERVLYWSTSGVMS